MRRAANMQHCSAWTSFRLAGTAGRQVEDPKKALLLYGNKTSQVVKDVLGDLAKLKAVRSKLNHEA